MLKEIFALVTEKCPEIWQILFLYILQFSEQIEICLSDGVYSIWHIENQATIGKGKRK